MKLVIQRVKKASVKVVSTGAVSGAIEKGLCILWGISRDDTWEDAEYCIRKALNIKLWDDVKDAEKAWSSSVVDNDYELLVVSQFTLFGTVKKGNKPDFHEAMAANQSKDFYNRIVQQLRQAYKPEKIQLGSFGNRMELSIENDGPVTIVIDSSQMQLKRLPTKPTQSKSSPSLIPGTPTGETPTGEGEQSSAPD